MENLILSSSGIIGSDVKNSLGENLGTIKDVVIDMEAGRVAYLVLAFGGFFGIGDKYYALPLEAFNVDVTDDKFILNIDKNRLKNAPGFNKDHWPTEPQKKFIHEVYTYYGIASYRKSETSDLTDSKTTESYNLKDEDTDVNPDRNMEESIYRSNFREDFPDAGTRNRDLDPDRNRYNY